MRAVVYGENHAVYDQAQQREGRFKILQHGLYDKFPQPHHNYKSLIAVRGEIGVLQINDSHIKARSPLPSPVTPWSIPLYPSFSYDRQGGSDLLVSKVSRLHRFEFNDGKGSSPERRISRSSSEISLTGLASAASRNLPMRFLSSTQPKEPSLLYFGEVAGQNDGSTPLC